MHAETTTGPLSFSSQISHVTRLTRARTQMCLVELQQDKSCQAVAGNGVGMVCTKIPVQVGPYSAGPLAVNRLKERPLHDGLDEVLLSAGKHNVSESIFEEGS